MLYSMVLTQRSIISKLKENLRRKEAGDPAHNPQKALYLSIFLIGVPEESIRVSLHVHYFS